MPYRPSLICFCGFVPFQDFDIPLSLLQCYDISYQVLLMMICLDYDIYCMLFEFCFEFQTNTDLLNRSMICILDTISNWFEYRQQKGFIDQLIHFFISTGIFRCHILNPKDQRPLYWHQGILHKTAYNIYTIVWHHGWFRRNTKRIDLCIWSRDRPYRHRLIVSQMPPKLSRWRESIALSEDKMGRMLQSMNTYSLSLCMFCLNLSGHRS